MQFIHVTSKPSKRIPDYSEASVRQTGASLISLIEGLSTLNFGIDTLNRAKRTIQKVKQKSVDPSNSKFYIDSGGYSIIAGQVPPSSIAKFINCYTNYLETEYSKFDYIFSLDIPIALNYPIFNTKENIYKFNKDSLSESIKAIEKHPELMKKFVFIYQFKMKSQYDIWNRLFKELDVKKYVNCYGLGGMVGLRGLLRNNKETEDIQFSPFIALMFKCLVDYISSQKFDLPFKIHNLGIYIRHDRFELQLLERLFNKYLENKINIQITYDSINYMRTAQLKCKDMDILSFEDDNLIRHPQIQQVPDNIIRQVYHNDLYYQHIQEELFNLKSNQRLNNIDCFVPLNVYSNVCLDKFFGSIIDKYELDDIFFRVNDYECFKRRTTPILTHLAHQYPKIFTSRLTTCIRENLRITYIFHKFFLNRPSDEEKMYQKLDQLIYQFIKKINFPFDLT